MIVAIPTVTKFPQVARKRTLVTTINSYIKAIQPEVLNMTYEFNEDNTVFAVPIECIDVENGIDPFGEWSMASENYWAYVLVQYDYATGKYTYGFTFKDSGGYGMYPVVQDKFRTSGSQIVKNITIKRPVNGFVTYITPTANWDGFKLGAAGEPTTKLVVLRAITDEYTGDKKNTCSIVTPGKNYDDYVKIFEDKTPPKCASITGGSTVWSKEEHTITVECKDDETYCERDKYVTKALGSGQTFTTKIYDAAGNSTSCVADVYQDLSVPSTMYVKVGSTGASVVSADVQCDNVDFPNSTEDRNCVVKVLCKDRTACSYTPTLSRYGYSPTVWDDSLMYATKSNGTVVCDWMKRSECKEILKTNSASIYKIKCVNAVGSECPGILTYTSEWSYLS